MDKRRAFKKAFWWGCGEHKLEALTNWLLLFDVMGLWLSSYFRDWFLIQLCLWALAFTFFVHCLARFCHRREKKYHKIANL